MRAWWTIGAAAVVGAGANAGVIEFSGAQNNLWNNVNNWVGGVLPGAGDRVVIPAGKTCNLDISTTVDTLEIEGTLNILAGMTLELENDDHNHCTGGPFPSCPQRDNHLVDGDGTVNIGEDIANGDAVLIVVSNDIHVFSGTGRVAGLHVESELQIDTDVTLVNQLDTDGGGIRGSMIIRGLTGGDAPGGILNEGLVEAKGTMVIAENTIIADVTDARWHVSCKTEMIFDEGATNLEGDFVHYNTASGIPEPGAFVFNESVHTCGAYIAEACGTIDVDEANDVTFSFATLDVEQFCDSCDTCPATPTCANPYVVETDKTGPDCM